MSAPTPDGTPDDFLCLALADRSHKPAQHLSLRHHPRMSRLARHHNASPGASIASARENSPGPPASAAGPSSPENSPSCRPSSFSSQSTSHTSARPSHKTPPTTSRSSLPSPSASSACAGPCAISGSDAPSASESSPHPARVGQPSRSFLAWNGTELICVDGHGLLHVPEMPTSWFSTQTLALSRSVMGRPLPANRPRNGLLLNPSHEEPSRSIPRAAKRNPSWRTPPLPHKSHRRFPHPHARRRRKQQRPSPRRTSRRLLRLRNHRPLRYDLSFRQSRPHGPPPRGSAERDQQGLRTTVTSMRQQTSGRIFLGGHSYGGRQASILSASEPGLVDCLLLLSYPLHPPQRPTELRTAHFPNLRTPALFLSGTRDGFATHRRTHRPH